MAVASRANSDYGRFVDEVKDMSLFPLWERTGGLKPGSSCVPAHWSYATVRPQLIRADARSTPLRSAAFDAAVLLFNSLGYGTDEDSLAMLRSARAAAPQLVVECAHRDEQVRRASPGVTREWMEIGEVRVLTERSIDPVEGVAHAIFRFGDREKRFRHRLYSATELVALLEAAGYASIDCYGAYDRRPFALDSPLFVAHARAA